MVDFKNYTAQQLEAAIDVIEQIEKANSPLQECVRLSAGILKELVKRLDDMEAQSNGQASVGFEEGM